MKTIRNRFEACIIAGAIGDAWGSSYEGETTKHANTVFYWGKPKQPPIKRWTITDDTQLTLATCEALSDKPFFQRICCLNSS